MSDDKELNVGEQKNEIGKSENKTIGTLEPMVSQNSLVAELRRIPLKLICQKAGLNETQASIILKMYNNVAREYLIDDWDSKLLEILHLLLRINLTQLARIPRDRFLNYSCLVNQDRQFLPFNNTPEAANNNKVASSNSLKTFNDDANRVAQNICRKKDSYLMLVNAAVYGKFNSEHHENAANYYNSAESFALYGIGDSLDNFFQSHDIEAQSQLRKNKCVKLETKKAEFELAPGANLSKPASPPTPISPNLNQYQPSFCGAPSYTTKQIQVPKQNLKKKTQQILMQSNLASQLLANIVPKYPPKIQPQPTARGLFTSPSTLQFFNETYINTSIVQQQQHHNLVEATNANNGPQPRAICLSNNNYSAGDNNLGGKGSTNNGKHVKKTKFFKRCKGLRE